MPMEGEGKGKESEWSRGGGWNDCFQRGKERREEIEMENLLRRRVTEDSLEGFYKS